MEQDDGTLSSLDSLLNNFDRKNFGKIRTESVSEPTCSTNSPFIGVGKRKLQSKIIFQPTNLIDRFWSSSFSSRPPVVLSKVNEILKHEANSAADLFIANDAVDVSKVEVEGGQTLFNDKSLFIMFVCRILSEISLRTRWAGEFDI